MGQRSGIGSQAMDDNLLRRKPLHLRRQPDLPGAPGRTDEHPVIAAFRVHMVPVDDAVFLAEAVEASAVVPAEEESLPFQAEVDSVKGQRAQAALLIQHLHIHVGNVGSVRQKAPVPCEKRQLQSGGS
ncbi:hypothetical protein D3C76_1415580 [compost metagenome]